MVPVCHLANERSFLSLFEFVFQKGVLGRRWTRFLSCAEAAVSSPVLTEGFFARFCECDSTFIHPLCPLFCFVLCVVFACVDCLLIG